MTPCSTRCTCVNHVCPPTYVMNISGSNRRIKVWKCLVMCCVLSYRILFSRKTVQKYAFSTRWPIPINGEGSLIKRKVLQRRQYLNLLVTKRLKNEQKAHAQPSLTGSGCQGGFYSLQWISGRSKSVGWKSLTWWRNFKLLNFETVMNSTSPQWKAE